MSSIMTWAEVAAGGKQREANGATNKQAVAQASRARISKLKADAPAFVPSRPIHHKVPNSCKNWKPCSAIKIQPIPQPRKKSNAQGGTSTTFHKFPMLPTELRLKVFKFYTEEDDFRLIEMERCPYKCCPDFYFNENDELKGSHLYRRVAPRSRLPPAILHINSETRYEYLKTYRKVSFDLHRKSSKRATIYFNPEKDILYFGENACITTLIHVTQIAYNIGLDLPRIAIRASGEFTKCCDWDEMETNDMGLISGVPGSCNLTQALHGISPALHDYRVRIPGCSGLKQVYFVAPSMFWFDATGNIDWSVGFRPAVGSGLTNNQRNFKDYNLMPMIKLVEKGITLRGIGEVNRWTGDQKPCFSFVSLCPKQTAGDDRIYDTVVVNKLRFPYLNTKAINQLGKTNDCLITWCEPPCPEHTHREIGLFGSEAAVKRTKGMIQEQLLDITGRFIKDIENKVSHYS